EGLSGYPSRAESEHDVLENSHASASLSWGDGIAKARQLTGQDDRHAVAVIGDGAVAGGMAREALATVPADHSTPARRRAAHASASLSWADGIAKARQLTGQDDRHVVAVIGDGALTGGMSWEALNTIAADTSTPPRRLVIIVNDNGRSYAPTVGGFAAHLDEL